MFVVLRTAAFNLPSSTHSLSESPYIIINFQFSFLHALTFSVPLPGSRFSSSHHRLQRFPSSSSNLAFPLPGPVRHLPVAFNISPSTLFSVPLPSLGVSSSHRRLQLFPSSSYNLAFSLPVSRGSSSPCCLQYSPIHTFNFQRPSTQPRVFIITPSPSTFSIFTF